jgi:hypothetical protein
MPRKLRVEFPGAIYHVMSRGDRREDIFQDDVDRQDFLKTLAETCQKTDFQVCHRSDQKGPPRVEIGPFWWLRIPHLGFG